MSLSGLTVEEATAALLSHEDRLVTHPAVFSIEGTEVTLDPELVGVAVPVSDVLGDALSVGRDASVWSQFRSWWGRLFDEVTVDLPVTCDEDALAVVLDQWDHSVIGQPPFNGSVSIEPDLSVTTAYPESGLVLARPSASEVVKATLESSDRQTRSLATRVVVPQLDRSAIDGAADTVRELLAGPITLTRTNPEATLVVEPAQIAEAVEVTITPTAVTVSLAVEAVDDILRPITAEFESPPVDAELVFNEDLTVTVQPGVPGDLISPELTANALLQAAMRADRTGSMPFERGAEPDVTTEDLESLGIRHLVSQFTTYHDCCQNRVVNIQLMADIVSGSIVQPGEEFSLNETVGERTTERGFLPAGTIVAGKIEDTVGGGVSQFATTTYNTVFWGGYEDVTHTPHSYYFSRYPEGIEATINWPSIDLVFRNDTDAAVLVRTLYTETSISVQIWGDNDGRIVAGEQRGGSTSITVVAEGGESARQVSADVTGRYAQRDPATEYVPNDELEPGTENVLESGRIGWSVTVTRVISDGSGTEIEQEWLVRYRPQPRIVEVHSCDIPEGEEGYTGDECPEPTTTTTSTTSTTTTSSSTTTTTVPG